MTICYFILALWFSVASPSVCTMRRVAMSELIHVIELFQGAVMEYCNPIYLFS